MAGEWSQAPLVEICEHSAFGPRFSGQLYATEGNVAILRTTDISEDGYIEYSTMPLAHLDLSKFQQHVLREDDLVVTRSGRVGTSAVFQGFRLPVLPGAFLIRFRLKRTVAEPRFYCYFFNSLAGRELTTSVATGSVQQNLNITSLHRLVIPVPPLHEQRAIAHVLGTLDDKIELNRRMNQTLEEMARALFQSWFVDFDPVRAKAGGHQPEGMDAEMAALFPSEFEDSELGEVPKGWRVRPIGDLIGTVGGSTPSTTEPAYWDGDVPFATPRDMSALTSSVILHTERKVTRAGLARIQSGLLPTGTVLMSSRAPIGYLAIAAVEVAVNQGIIAMVPNGGLPGYFALCWARENMETIVANAGGTTFPEISKRNFRPLPAIEPPRAVLDRFVELVEPIYTGIVANLREADTVEAIRDALLPKLLSGELRIEEAEDVAMGHNLMPEHLGGL